MVKAKQNVCHKSSCSFCLTPSCKQSRSCHLPLHSPLQVSWEHHVKMGTKVKVCGKGQSWRGCALWIVLCKQLPPLFLFMNEFSFYNRASWLQLHGKIQPFLLGLGNWHSEMFFQVSFLLVGSPVGKDGMETVEAWGRVGAGGSIPEMAESLAWEASSQTLYWDPEEQLEMVWPVLSQIGCKDWSDGDFAIVLSLCGFF